MITKLLDSEFFESLENSSLKKILRNRVENMIA